MTRAVALLTVACACAGHRPTVDDALIVSVSAWDALDASVTQATARRADAIVEWRRLGRCGRPDEIHDDCVRASAAGRDLADFVARWDALSLTVDVVLVLWRGGDPKATIGDVAPEAIDRVLASVRGREAQAAREALVEARRISREVW